MRFGLRGDRLECQTHAGHRRVYCVSLVSVLLGSSIIGRKHPVPCQTLAIKVPGKTAGRVTSGLESSQHTYVANNTCMPAGASVANMVPVRRSSESALALELIREANEAPNMARPACVGDPTYATSRLRTPAGSPNEWQKSLTSHTGIPPAVPTQNPCGM